MKHVKLHVQDSYIKFDLAVRSHKKYAQELLREPQQYLLVGVKYIDAYVVNSVIETDVPSMIATLLVRRVPHISPESSVETERLLYCGENPEFNTVLERLQDTGIIPPTTKKIVYDKQLIDNIFNEPYERLKFNEHIKQQRGNSKGAVSKMLGLWKR